ncbi:hypothetical protein G647_01478 [Cladophialophora carrionii CBS 160.54]|uniref:F-box domain-containing protein n=1 Tax=Cladophialophora carrionii CBS 160.54 TaxID=1279043 RepID=V9DQ71_9EURO|nr:uncharacterized protein G647_01478 [Cladophialophora carrionii CBS 160.54]ETI29025.1 hypothetical protein G647_01478 [Cladophialophora carrionii CBS 160.54]
MDPYPAPSLTADALRKRRYRGETVMRVQSQFRNTGGSSSQVFNPKPLSAPITAPFSFETSKFSLRGPFQTPEQVAPRPTKRARVAPVTFLNATVDCTKDGRRITFKSDTTESISAESPSENTTLPAKTVEKGFRTRLGPSHPVKLSSKIYADVWIRILSFCEPKFLLEAKTIDKFRYGLLSEHSVIWKESRLNYYGPDMPDCPKNLTEQQYVELMAGRGCQNSRCAKGDTHKVHWNFRVRLCSGCLAQKIMRVEELSSRRQYFLPNTGYELNSANGLALWELLPLARLDGRDLHPLKIDEASNNWALGQGNPRRFRFLMSSYAKLESEYKQLDISGAGDEVIKAWADMKHEETMEVMTHAIKLESWCKQHILHKHTTEAQDLRQIRANYFEARALELSPPMEKRVLHKMADFQKALKIRAQPTERSWDALRRKIEPYRSHAEQVLEFELLMESFLDPLPQVKLFKELHERRHRRKGSQRTYQPEQEYVLRLGRAEFDRCIKNHVADEDLLLLCLKNVFDTYSTLNHRPYGFNFDGTFGTYRLSLDDARMIVEDVIEKQIPRNSSRGRVVFPNLRCRGCRRTDYVRSFSFVQAFEHILEKHARHVGEGLEFYQFARPYPKTYNSWTSPDDDAIEFKFPWYTTFWPRTLPLVPRHCEPSKMEHWHPAVPTDFVQVKKPPNLSPFGGRRPCDTGNPDDAFAKNLIYASEKLYGLALDGPCQLKIALKFALDLYAKKHASEPPVSNIITCLDLLRTVNPRIDLRFGCGICGTEDKVYRSLRQTKYRKAVEQLEKHWTRRHHGGSISWTKGMIQLPTESEVWLQIVSSDKKLRTEQAALMQREMTRHKDIKKRAHAKANAILQQRAAQEVFDELFPQQQ